MLKGFLSFLNIKSTPRASKRLKRVQCICYPRSGHRLLRTCLRDYFGKRLVVCAVHSHCKSVPCISPDTNYQKNHDFKLKTPNNHSMNYIIQYRTPLESIVSLYKYNLNCNASKIDNRHEWERFCLKNISYWRKFVKKWVIKNKNQNTLFIEYSELVENPKKKIIGAARFMLYGKKFNKKKALKIIRRKDISYRSDIREFKYYDPKFLKKIEDSAKKEIEILGLKKYF